MARANSGDSKYLGLWSEELIYFEKSVLISSEVFSFRWLFFCETGRSYSGISNGNILA